MSSNVQNLLVEGERRKPRIKKGNIIGRPRAKIVPAESYVVDYTPKFIRKKYRRFVKYWLKFDNATEAYKQLVIDGLARGKDFAQCASALVNRPDVLKIRNKELKKSRFIDDFTKERFLFEIEEIKRNPKTSAQAKLNAIEMQRDIVGDKQGSTLNLNFLNQINPVHLAEELINKRKPNLKVIDHAEDAILVEAVNEGS